ncbi:DUF502 domain-containing protein [Mariniblastus sp.]|nr:DUF502 domain-containing protein [Mariniblastus sp.]MDA7904237.1 DUF502 domain-containing protein [bacterium]MDC0294117.1 DUF502 domain-containing protein [Mariniblastus sp.]
MTGAFQFKRGFNCLKVFGKVDELGNIRTIRNRIIAGLFVLMPLFITFAIIRWLYDTLYSIALGPISSHLKSSWLPSGDEPSFLLDSLFSLAAFVSVLAILFVAGIFFRSRVHSSIDWVLLNVPGVSTIYSAVNNVFQAISSSQNNSEKFKRVVLVAFPHPGMKAPAFVTGESVDVSTGRTILCVYVPTTPVPTSGYMLMVEQEDVIELNWDLEETLQAIVSGGITVPDTVTYQPEMKKQANSNGTEANE